MTVSRRFFASYINFSFVFVTGWKKRKDERALKKGIFTRSSKNAAHSESSYSMNNEYTHTYTRAHCVNFPRKQEKKEESCMTTSRLNHFNKIENQWENFIFKQRNNGYRRDY